MSLDDGIKLNSHDNHYLVSPETYGAGPQKPEKYSETCENGPQKPEKYSDIQRNEHTNEDIHHPRSESDTDFTTIYGSHICVSF